MVLDTYFINGNIQVNKISAQRFPLPTVQDKLHIKEMHAFNLLLACFQCQTFLYATCRYAMLFQKIQKSIDWLICFTL